MKQLLLAFGLIFSIEFPSFAQCSTTISGTLNSCTTNCNGSVTFTSTVGTPPYNLVVTNGPSVQYTSSFTWTNVCPGSYFYDITDATMSCHDTGTVTITAIPTVTPPVLTIEAFDIYGSPIGNNPTICQFQSIDFWVQGFFETTEPKTFKWKKNGIVQLTQTAVNPLPPGIGWNSSSLVSGDIISLTVIFTNPPPCYSPDSVTSQSITFTVTPNQPPMVTISHNFPSDTICYGNVVTFTANALEAGNPAYQWYLDGSPVGSASIYNTLATLLPGNHNIWCEITSNEVCDLWDPVYSQWASSSQINLYVQICTFISEQGSENTITIYPNPVSNKITMYDVRFTISEIGIYNVLSEKVYSRQPETSNADASISIYNRQPVTINVSTLPPGLYFIKLKGENEESVAKFVKQ